MQKFNLKKWHLPFTALTLAGKIQNTFIKHQQHLVKIFDVFVVAFFANNVCRVARYKQNTD